MCHYLGGGLHGRKKRVKAQSESSKSVVNSVLISREMPVFPGFLEIIRVVNLNLKKGYDYLLPIFTFGKYYEDGGKYYIPLSIQVHHAVCDGFHVCRFLDELQDLLNK
jgi:chloramphenicol O-acetyltransferase